MNMAKLNIIIPEPPNTNEIGKMSTVPFAISVGLNAEKIVKYLSQSKSVLIFATKLMAKNTTDSPPEIDNARFSSFNTQEKKKEYPLTTKNSKNPTIFI